MGDALGEVVVTWPAKHGAEVKAQFGEGFDIGFEEVLDEMVYFLAFGTDYAIYVALKESPRASEALRTAFARPVGRYAIEHHCKPVIPGDWMDSSWIWMPTGAPPKVSGNPLDNLNDRYTQYAAAIKRRANRETSIGESSAHLLAGWCMNLDISFLLFASTLMTEHLIRAKDLILKFQVKP